MIDVTCPNCGELAEVDPEKLKGVDIIGCQSCDSQFRYTLAGDVLTFGEEVTDDEEEGDDEEEDEEDEDADDDEEEDDEETEIEELDEDEEE